MPPTWDASVGLCACVIVGEGPVPFGAITIGVCVDVGVVAEAWEKEPGDVWLGGQDEEGEREALFGEPFWEPCVSILTPSGAPGERPCGADIDGLVRKTAPEEEGDAEEAVFEAVSLWWNLTGNVWAGRTRRGPAKLSALILCRAFLVCASCPFPQAL